MLNKFLKDGNTKMSNVTINEDNNELVNFPNVQKVHLTNVPFLIGEKVV